MIRSILCWLGFHKPDKKNAVRIDCPLKNPTKEDYYLKYYKTKCLSCNAEMLGTEW